MTSLRNILLTTVCVTFFAASHAPIATATDLATQTAHEEGDVDANPHDLIQGSHVEGHIAFLRAELGITPAQEPLWDTVAEAMREDVRSMQDAQRKADHQRHQISATEYLEKRAEFAELRAQGEARFLTAFRALYSRLSSAQKQSADAILIPDPDQ